MPDNFKPSARGATTSQPKCDAGGAPLSLPKYLFERNRARSMDGAIPSPGLSKQELDRKLDLSAQRAKLRERDFFSIPAADNRIELALKSLPGARNDIKKQKGDTSEEFGNFLFGAEAAAAGMSEGEATGWGAFAQPFQDVLKGQWPSWHDNDGDPAAIQQGHRYFHQRRRR